MMEMRSKRSLGMRLCLTAPQKIDVVPQVPMRLYLLYKYIPTVYIFGGCHGGNQTPRLPAEYDVCGLDCLEYR